MRCMTTNLSAHPAGLHAAMPAASRRQSRGRFAPGFAPVARKFDGDGGGGDEKKVANLMQSSMVGATGFEPVTSTV